MDENVRHKRAIEEELRMLRLQLHIAREGEYENMVHRLQRDIEEVERELERARRR